MIKEHENCECHDMLSKTDVCMPEKCHIIHEDYLDLFTHYEIKAQKYDDLMAASNDVVKDNLQLADLQRQLKEIKDISDSIEIDTGVMSFHAQVKRILENKK